MTNKLSIAEASKIMGLANQTLRVFIRNGKFSEFSTCYKNNLKWTYYINRTKFFDYIENN